jgi:hypothetical protein
MLGLYFIGITSSSWLYLDGSVPHAQYKEHSSLLGKSKDVSLENA